MTYTPKLTLYVTGDAHASQVLSTIGKSNPIYTWDMASSAVVDQSNWKLYLNENDTYQIKPDAE